MSRHSQLDWESSYKEPIIDWVVPRVKPEDDGGEFVVPSKALIHCALYED